jgi:hypothetical protein
MGSGERVRRRAAFMAVVIVSVALAVVPATRARAANPWPHVAMGGFSTSKGDGFWVDFADGGVDPHGSARFQGNAVQNLNAPVVTGAALPGGNGYWLAAADGGVFSFGGAKYYGGTAGKHLNALVSAMAPTPTGKGYWLVARDGGVFAFGDAGFFGSLSGKPLGGPIVGIESSRTGRGYRLLGADGGLFTFGDAKYLGSVPGKGVHVSDVVGLAATPDNGGYWIARKGGQVLAFGNAQPVGSYTAGACDSVVGIFSNPTSPGYRLVTSAGATISFGAPLAGPGISGTQRWCVMQMACPGQFATMADYQRTLDTRGPMWENGDGATTIDVGDGRRIWLFGDTYIGPSDATTVLPGYQFARNALAVQQGGCMQFRAGGPDILHAIDYIPRPAPKEWYWPNAGVVDRDAGVIYVSAMHAATDSNGPDGFRWRLLDSELIALDYNSLVPLYARKMPSPYGLLWGTSILQVGNWIYIYARGGDKPRQYVARTTMAHLLDGHWEFWNGNAWSTSPTPGQMRFRSYDGGPDPGPLPAATVEQYGSGYLLSSKRCDMLCDDLSAWYSTSPSGPWYAVNSATGRVLTTTTRYPSQIVYGGHLIHTQAGWLGVWTVNRGYVTMLKYMYSVLFGLPQNLPTADALAARFTHPPTPTAAAMHAALPEPTLVETPVHNGLDLPTSAGFAQH